MTYKAGDMLEYNNYVSYNCSGDKETEPMRTVKCTVAGDEVEVTCPRT